MRFGALLQNDGARRIDDRPLNARGSDGSRRVGDRMAPLPPEPEAGPDLSLGPELVHRGIVSASGLMQAMIEASRRRVPLPGLLRSLGLADDAALARVLADRHATRCLGPGDGLPDPRLIDRLGASRWLQLECIPWRNLGAVTLVATTDPDGFATRRPEVEAVLGPVAIAVLPEAGLRAAVESVRACQLRDRAEASVDLTESCRDWNGTRAARMGVGLLGLLGLAMALAPVATSLALLTVLLLTLLVTTGLRFAAALAAFRVRKASDAPFDLHGPAAPLPVVTLLVPLFREPEIAPRLVARLAALDYPRDLLDVVLVVEADDRKTRDALSRARLPGWMRVISVPEAKLRTKPRAMNYALNFARGTLVGVYDAEDAPDRDQLHRIARAFADGGPDLACVQGVLDYYNPHSNWMARCFTIEYAAWFRLVLTGFARLGLVVPLGGTTLFFRREVLERLGGWDAHNVTEDADLGVRLARHGYRTELVHTVTQEEANCRILPWIRQRSRWLKGYAMTYAVHMRDPARLWRDLGAWKFFGVQVLFLGTLVQFLLAPIFWSLWLLIFGLDLPLAQALPPATGWITLAVLLLCEAVSLTVNLMALTIPRHRALRPWVLTMQLYFPLATVAAYKAMWEMLTRPFYWDKTAHGVDDAGHRTLHGLN